MYVAWKLGSGTAGDRTVLIADAFTLPGMFFTGVGGIGLISRSGIYDIPAYAVRGIAELVMGKAKTGGFLCYKNKKTVKGMWCNELLAVGIVFLIVAVAMVCHTA